MANKQRAFQEVQTIADFKQDLTTYPRYVYKACLTNENVDYALNALNIMTEENEEKFLRFLHHIDRNLSMGGTAAANRYHKIPTALAGAIYFAYYPETVEELSLDEMTVLAKYMCPEPFDNYPAAVEHFGKELLGTIHSIGIDFMYRETYMNLANKKLEEGLPREEVTAYMTSKPIEELNQEAFEFEREELERVGKYL